MRAQRKSEHTITTMSIIGYKGFNKNTNGTLQCRNLIFDIGKQMTHDGPVKMGASGLHYCTRFSDVLDYYPPKTDTVYCLIHDTGDNRVLCEDPTSTSVCTNRLVVVMLLDGPIVYPPGNPIIYPNTGPTEIHRFQHGQLHCTDGAPAAERLDDNTCWFINGVPRNTYGQISGSAHVMRDLYWYVGNLSHRDKHQPSTECFNGCRQWHCNGSLHREDGLPAIEFTDGTKRWYCHGLLHRTDGPAIVDEDGTKLWYFNDLLHRTDGPAVEEPNGTKMWYLNDLLHRLDGPSFEGKDVTKWYVNGLLHRLDGPAVEYASGLKYYYLNGTSQCVLR